MIYHEETITSAIEELKSLGVDLHQNYATDRSERTIRWIFDLLEQKRREKSAAALSPDSAEDQH